MVLSFLKTSPVLVLIVCSEKQNPRFPWAKGEARKLKCLYGIIETVFSVPHLGTSPCAQWSTEGRHADITRTGLRVMVNSFSCVYV